VVSAAQFTQLHDTFKQVLTYTERATTARHAQFEALMAQMKKSDEDHAKQQSMMQKMWSGLLTKSGAAENESQPLLLPPPSTLNL
jgi:hypothetical protein